MYLSSSLDFFCVDVMYSGEYNACDITLNVYPHQAYFSALKIHFNAALYETNSWINRKKGLLAINIIMLQFQQNVSVYCVFSVPIFLYITIQLMYIANYIDAHTVHACAVHDLLYNYT
jgi:hypothetical protein